MTNEAEGYFLKFVELSVENISRLSALSAARGVYSRMQCCWTDARARRQLSGALQHARRGH